jgi:hypothetical protein
LEKDAEKSSGFQAMINNLVWDNGYTQIVSGSTRGGVLIYIPLLRSESSLFSCNTLSGISDHNGVLSEVEWDKICQQPNSPGVPQKRCFRLASLSSGKV